MIKEVAKAIGDTVYGYVDENDTPNTWATSMEMARAAIEAMMMPTEAMVSAVTDEGDCYLSFQQMIRAALEEKTNEMD